MSELMVLKILVEQASNDDLKRIGEKVIVGERITPEEGVILFEKGSLSYLGALANWVREKKHGNKTYFNRNFHIEPTNICVFSCNFCSYSKLYAHREEGWELTANQMLDIVKKYDGQPVTAIKTIKPAHYFWRNCPPKCRHINEPEYRSRF